MPYDSHSYMSYWLLLADVSALYSQCDWRVNVISRLDYDWQTGMSGTHLIFIALVRESCWHTGFCKWATDTFLIVFCLIRVGLGRSGAADNGKLQTVLIDLQSFDFREFKSINFYTVFRIGLRWVLKKTMHAVDHDTIRPSQIPRIIELQLNILIIVIMEILPSKWGLSL